MEKLNLTHRAFIKILIPMALTVALGWTNWKMYSVLTVARDTIQEIEKKIAAMEEQKRSAKRFQNLRIERREDIDRINSFFVNKEKPVEFIEDLEELARNTKNRLLLSVDSTATGNILKFRIEIEGTQESVFRYLKLLELVPYEAYITDISMSKIIGSRGPVSQLEKSGAVALATTKLGLALKVRTK